MDNRRLNTILHQLNHLPGVPGGGALTDGQLLGRFVSRRDEAAFELLVRRHGPLVWGVCRRVLGSPHDAEDAFQATFLVLVRRAVSLDRTRPLSAWLYGVACRVALRAREAAARRRQHERAAGRAEEWHESGAEARDLRRVLDEELNRLPEKYRVPLILCYLEGKTHEEAAQQLGWPLGTLKCRVLRGREQLRHGLARRGLGASAPLPTVPPPAVAPSALVGVTLAASLEFAAGSATAGPASLQAVALAQGVLKTMTVSKLKIAATLLLLASVLAVGAGGLAASTRSGDPTGVPVASAAEPGGQDAKPQEPAPIDPKLAALWADLASEDEGKAWRAAFALAAKPKDATLLFQGRLKPVTVDAERLNKLIRDLDSDDFETREKASAELRNTGELAAPPLRKALEGKPSAEAKRRIEDLLTHLGKPSPATVRAARIVAILEAVGNDDARKLLEATAKGQADAGPTTAARAALDRMNGKPADWQAHYDALGSKDEATALRAAIAAVGTPKESIPAFKERLAKGLPGAGAGATAPAADEKLVGKLIDDLGAADFNTRENATKELLALGAPAGETIRTVLKKRGGNLDPEPARRLEVILAKLGNAPAPAAAPGSANRLIVVLAYLDTPESRDLLETVRKKDVQQAQTATSPDGRLRVATQQDLVHLLDVASGKLLWQAKTGPGPQCVAFSPDGKTVAAGNAGGDVVLLDAATGKMIRLMRDHKVGVVGVGFSPDGKTLRSVDSGGAATTWEMATGAKLP